MAGLERVVGEHPFFAGLSAEYSQLVAGCARNHRFEAEQYLFREGEPANEFFLIRHGKVALEIHAPGRAPIVFTTLGEGEIVGASWFRPIAGPSTHALWRSPAPSASMPPVCAGSSKRTITSATR